MTTTYSPNPIGAALHALHVSGAFYCRCELTTPWGLTLPPMPGCLWFHIVTAGECQLDVDETEPRRLQPGELALVPHGRGHLLRSEPDVAVPNVIDLPHEYASNNYAILHYGGDGPVTKLVCGAVQLDHPSAHTLGDLLPTVIHLATLSAPQTDWMHATLGLIAAESEHLRPGGETVITRLSDILVIQGIRSWIEHDAEARTGWLAALRDPQIGRAIALIHRYPDRAWTLAALAGEVTMSRSAFAARFTQLAGEPAMGYLTRWRMYVALHQLRRGDVTVTDLARRLGYQSEAAFHRAFKRIIGVSPGTAKHDSATNGAVLPSHDSPATSWPRSLDDASIDSWNPTARR